MQCGKDIEVDCVQCGEKSHCDFDPSKEPLPKEYVFLVLHTLCNLFMIEQPMLVLGIFLGKLINMTKILSIWRLSTAR